MSWNIEFVSPSKAAAVKELMHPRLQEARGLPIAIREQVITMIEMLTEQDQRSFVHIKTYGHLSGESSAAAANRTIEVKLMPSYAHPFPPEP